MAANGGVATHAPRLGVSSCLLGAQVRYDGGHKRDDFLVDTLGRFVEWVQVCPEMELGLGTPRESLRLVRAAGGTRLVAVRSGTDHTDRMRTWARKRLDELAALDLDGYVFKKDSPSCGFTRVKIFRDGSAVPARTGRGMFAAALIDRFPLLPVEEEGRLRDPALRENFVDRVWAYHRWTALLSNDRAPAALIDFHAAHELTLLSHSPKLQRELGQIVARAGTQRGRGVFDEYGSLFMRTLAIKATRGKHANTLEHLMGFLETGLDAADKQELVAAVQSYRRGLVPLDVPLTLLRHHVRRCAVPEWVHAQVYLDPYPSDLMLRNQV